MLVCPTITPAALLTTLWEASKMPMTISQVWVTMTTAQADLNTHLKNIQVSTSFRLLRSVTSWISSRVITIARIAPAIGRITVLERFWIMVKIPLFQLCGVMPTWPTMLPTCSLVESNIPERLLTMPLMRISFSQSVMLSQIKSIEYPPIDQDVGNVVSSERSQ